MSKPIIVAAILLLFLFPALRAQYEEAGPDYTMALQKKAGEARIQAFDQYIRKYPDTNQNMFTKYAYYWLAFDHYSGKNYGEAIRNGEKFLSFGGMDKKLEAGASLILANAYGVQGPRFNQAAALRHADKAIAIARDGGMNDIAQQAQALKSALSGGAPAKPAKAATPVQKIGVAYTAKKYDEVVSIYNGFSEADKQSDPLVFEAYVRALMALGRVDAAIRDLSDSFGRARKGITAERLGKIYQEKSNRDRKLLDTAISYYVQAGLLYGKENNSSRRDAVNKVAKYQLYEKYGYNAKAAAVNAKVKNQPKPVDNTREIEKLQRDYERLEQQLATKYGDMEMPAYEQDKLDKIAAQIQTLKSNKPKPPDEKTAEEVAALEKERVRIETEFNGLVGAERKKLGM